MKVFLVLSGFYNRGSSMRSLGSSGAFWNSCSRMPEAILLSGPYNIKILWHYKVQSRVKVSDFYFMHAKYVSFEACRSSGQQSLAQIPKALQKLSFQEMAFSCALMVLLKPHGGCGRVNTCIARPCCKICFLFIQLSVV